MLARRMPHFLEALANRTNLVLDALTGRLVDAQLLYQLREMERARGLFELTPSTITTLLMRGANPNAKSITCQGNATDLAIGLGVEVAQCLLDAGGKPTSVGIFKLAGLAVWHYCDVEDSDSDQTPYDYAAVARLCIERTADDESWHWVHPYGYHYQYSVIARLELASPGLSQVLRKARKAMGLEENRDMDMPHSQTGLNNALVRTLQNREPDCDDAIDDMQRMQRVTTLLRAGADPNANTTLGRAMGEAINTLDIELVDTMVTNGGKASHSDMAVVLEKLIGEVDNPSEFKLVMRSVHDENALFQIISRCYPPEFSWKHTFEVADWEGDSMVVDMAYALSHYAGRLQSIQDHQALRKSTPSTPSNAAARRI